MDHRKLAVQMLSDLNPNGAINLDHVEKLASEIGRRVKELRVDGHHPTTERLLQEWKAFHKKQVSVH